ncbi:MAG: hypothetical protein ACC649_04485 [Myxococcota bacterium]
MISRIVLAAFTLITSLVFGVGGASADGPAVSEAHPLVGASVEAIGADHQDVQVFLADGAYYAPVGESLGFGLRLSVGLGLDEGDAKEAVAGGGFFFWADRASVYFGVEVGGIHFGDLDRWGGGAIGGVYFEDWDLGGSGGFSGGDGDDGGVFGINAGWYATEQLRLGASGIAGTDEVYGGEASIEWQPFGSESNWVLGADAGGGSADGTGFYSAGVQLLYHFASPKSLKRQLREDRL